VVDTPVPASTHARPHPVKSWCLTVVASAWQRAALETSHLLGISFSFLFSSVRSFVFALAPRQTSGEARMRPRFFAAELGVWQSTHTGVDARPW